jgi:hypothetical protein
MSAQLEEKRRKIGYLMRLLRWARERGQKINHVLHVQAQRQVKNKLTGRSVAGKMIDQAQGVFRVES